MDNFYEEHKGYLKLKKKLEDYGHVILTAELMYVVGDAVQYGIDMLAGNSHKEVQNGTASNEKT